jgi:small subunit ribosomal protein S9
VSDENGEQQESAEEQAPEEAPAEEGTPEETPEEEAPAEEGAPEETPKEETPEEEAPAAEEAPAEARKPAPKKGDGDEAAPGAELEPISIEPERELSAEERARREAEEEERAAREAAATDDSEEPVVRREKIDLDADTRVQATGKRKTSIARVILKSGSGGFKVNSRSLDEYFPRPQHQTVARQALAASGLEDSVDVAVRVRGGGVSGQAGAVRHGVARALTEIDPELRGELKRRGMLTRDARAKERRKAGLKKARKRPQFSKR